jgi:hypothetical protein
MRSFSLALVVGLAGVVLAPFVASAQGPTVVIDSRPPPASRVITIDFGAFGWLSARSTPVEPPSRLITIDFTPPGMPDHLPPPPAPAPGAQPLPAAPPPQVYPAGHPPSGYCPVDCCADGSFVWARAEWLLWWVRSQPVPPLVTASPAGAGPLAGVLGQPGTSLVVGGAGANGDAMSGARFTAGVWFDDCHTIGFQASYFFLGGQTTAQTPFATGPVQLFRPFFDAAAHQPAAIPITGPGGANVRATLDDFQGLQGCLRENVYGVGEECRASWVRVDALTGISYLNLREGLSAQAVGPSGFSQDTFRTRNEFYGGQLGLDAEMRRGALLLQADAGLALGVTAQSVLVDSANGLLTQASNAGLHRHATFSLIPQCGLKAGLQLHSNVRLFVAYNFLFWPGVARPGDQVDLVVNRNQTVPGPLRPAFAFRETDLWVQGLGFGVEVMY